MSYRVPIDDPPPGSVFMFVREICRCCDITFSICHVQGVTLYETDIGPDQRYFYRDGSQAFTLFCEFQSLRLTGDFLSDTPWTGWTGLGDGRWR